MNLGYAKEQECDNCIILSKIWFPSKGAARRRRQQEEDDDPPYGWESDPESNPDMDVVTAANIARAKSTTEDSDQPGMSSSVDDVQLVMFNKHAGDSNGILPNGKIPVRLSVVFMKIGEIDTLKENYEADVLINIRWKEPRLDRQRLQDGEEEPVNWSQYWNPAIYIENVLGEPKETAFRLVSYNDNGEATVHEKKRIKGVFLESLELKDFPFDVQDLTVTLMSHRPPSEIEILEDQDDPHRVNKQSFVDEQEWSLYKYIETHFKEMSNEFTDPAIKKVALQVMCRAARRPAYFLYNIFLVTFLICSLSFATFAVKRELPQNRLQLSFTLVLTTVAFKFVVNQSLPKISYLTYLDKYVLAALILLIIVCIWHAITTVISSDEEQGRLIDLIALGVVAGCYILFNLIFCLEIYRNPGKTRQMMEKKEKEYSEAVTKKLVEKKDRKSVISVPEYLG